MYTASQYQIDKKLVKDSFRASGPTYEDKAVVQKVISRRLVTFLGTTCHSNFASVLEIGCCTGYLTEFLCHRFSVREVYINDLVEDFCIQTHDRLLNCACNLSAHQLPGDIESLRLPSQLDLVISSSTLQWMVDLKGLFERMAKSLNDDGYLAFSIFCPGTMKEINSITGRGLLYHDKEKLKGIVQENFSIELFTNDTHTLYFPSVRAILRHIQQTGVGGLGRTKWTRSSLQEFEHEYRQRYESEKGLPITYCSNYVIAKRRG